MEKSLILYKKEGETPLETLEAFREKNKLYKEAKMTYAGRLDPMAEGALLVLVGDEVHNKEKYLSLKKEYTFQVLFGFATDTYDILGRVTDTTKVELNTKTLEVLIQKNLKYFKGIYVQTYPLFSSRTVNGKALFEYARKGESVEIPQREVTVTKLNFLKLRKVKGKQLFENIKKRIKKVNGDFRQEEIITLWQQKLSPEIRTTFFIATFTVSCSSGTYVRSIAHNLGKRIGVPALAFSINRTKIGKWSLKR